MKNSNRIPVILLYLCASLLSFFTSNYLKAQQVVKVGAGEYLTVYLMSDKTVKVSNQSTITPILSTYSGLDSIIDVQGGQYHVTALDQQGKVYKLGNTAGYVMTTVDEFGSAFTANFQVKGFWQCNVSLRGTDSSLWYWGIADPMNYYAGATITAPKKLLMPSGKKFKKVETGAFSSLSSSYILALATDGSVWRYDRNNPTPYQITISGQTIIDICTLGGAAQVLLTASNKLFAAGVLSTYAGTASNTTTYTDVTTAWTSKGMTFPIKELVGNSSTLHIIDANNNMFGSGTNVQGEVGTGVEYSPYRIAGPQGGVFGYGFTNGVLLTPPTQIQGKFKNLNTSTTITFYLYVQDMGNNWYSWGRNKGFSLGNGKSAGPYAGWGGAGDYASYPNAMDVPMPKRVNLTTLTWVLQSFDPNASIPPVVGAGINQYLSSVSSTTLYGKAFQQEQTIASNTWTKVSGPAGGTITNTGSLNTTITGLSNGTYVYRLSATNSNGQTSTDDVSIIVSSVAPPTNITPTINAGTDKTITLPISTTTLNGSASDADGTISSYFWTKISGPTGGTINSNTTASTAIAALQAGIYTYSLTVTDNAGATATDTVQVTVNAAANQVPTGNAGLDINITLPTNSTPLSGAGTDSDGTIASYAWVKISGPAAGTLTNANTASSTAAGLVQGVYSYQLTVTDNAGAAARDSVNVTVDAAINIAPTVNAGLDANITLPTNSSPLSGTGTDADGTIASYAWMKISGPATGTLTNAATANATATSLVQGVYSYQLTVTDNVGAVARDTINVNVNAATITLLPAVNPANTVNGIDYKYYEGNWSVLPAFASLTPVKTGFTNNFNISLANKTTQFGFSFTGYINVPSDGQYKFYTSSDDGSNLYIDNVLTVANDGLHGTVEKSGLIGLKAGKHAITGLFFQQSGGQVFIVSYEGMGITKQAIPAASLYRVNTIPVSNAGADKTLTLPTNSTTLTGAGTDTDGTIASYAWVKIAGPTAGTLTNAATANASAASLVQGIYSYQLTVTDDAGAIGRDTINVTVNAAINIAPIVNAGLDANITLPTNSSSLRGLGTDADGTIASYAWVKISGPAAGTLTNAATANATAASLVQGVYSYQLTVTDNAGAMGRDTVNVNVNTATITLLPAVNPANTVNGLEYKYYQGTWSVLPAFSSLTPVKKGNTSNFNISLATRTSKFGFSFTGFINVPSDGQYKFYTTSDDGSNLYIDNVLVVANDGSHTAIEKSGLIGLKAGKHIITGLYFQLSGSKVFTVKYEGTGILKQTIPSSSLYRVNVLPVSNAGSNLMFSLPTNAATLTGSGTDADGTVAGYQWKKVSGPTQGNIVSATNATSVINNLVQGIYSFELTVTDNDGGTQKDSVLITVNPSVIAIAPVANAGTDNMIQLPANRFLLDGRSSTDADGTIATYQWSLVSGPAGSTLLTATKDTCTVNFTNSGTYTFKLTVTDNNGLSATDNVQVIVQPALAISKALKVNLDNGTAPYVNPQWNNWIPVANVNSSNFKYEDGTQSSIFVNMPQGGSFSDNGVNYAATVTNCPPAVLRITSMHTITRIFTVNGLNPNKQYGFEFYGSRAFTSGSKSVFKTGNVADTINTDFNESDFAKFNNISPDNTGKIEFTLSIIGSYHYLSAFTITEQADIPVSFSPTSLAKQVYQGENIVEMGADAVSVYPNPFTGSFKVQLNNKTAGAFVLKLTATSGQTVFYKKINKASGTAVETINVNNLTPGTYILEIISVATGNKTVHKVIKN